MDKGSWTHRRGYKPIKDWCKLIQGKLEDDKDVTYLSHTIPSHKIVMTAEESDSKAERF